MAGRENTVILLGGAGAMGRITVRDLYETAPHLDVVIADYSLPAAKKLAASYKSPRIRAVAADVRDVRATTKILKTGFVVINSVHHKFNVQVMKAALAARTHYLDLGGLFYVTREQLKMHSAFKKADLLALLGIGAAPGVVNVMARSVADTLDEVHEIHVMVAGVDNTPGRAESPLGTSYSIETILEESTRPAPVFTKGKFTWAEPMSGVLDVDFPPPVGRRRPALTIHSEVATLPLTYKAKGIQESTFRIAFSEDLDSKLRFLRALGVSSTEPLRVGKADVVPQQLLIALALKLPVPAAGGPPDEYEILRVLIRGMQGGRPVNETVDCHVHGIPAWSLGVDADTGCPPSIAAQMLARGEITARGTVPAEVAVPAVPFFAELAKRGMRIERFGNDVIQTAVR